MLSLFLVFFSSASASEHLQPGYGYVGPACAVVDGTLFLHGVARRVLSKEESDSFGEYQRQLSLFSQGYLEHDAPFVPSFCGGYDDSVEVILSSCIVRNNHVYEGERLVRPLTNREKQRLATVLSRRSRAKRSVDPSLVKQHDFSALLHKFLNVNSSVTSRFLPVVSQSPLFSMEGLGEVFGKGEKETTIAAAEKTTETTATTTEPSTKATFRPLHTKPTRKRLTTKSMYTTPVTTEQTTTSRATERKEDILRPIYVTKKLSKKPSTTTVATVVVPGEETVKDPILLQLIAQALEKNQLLDNLLQPSTPPSPTSVPFHSQPEKENKAQPVNLHFVPPFAAWNGPSSTVQGPTPNIPFAPHMSFTSLGGNNSNRRRKPTTRTPSLPDDICRGGQLDRKMNML